MPVETSAERLDFSIDSNQSDSNNPAPGAAGFVPDSSNVANVPKFSGYGPVYADAARRAGRINAAAISDGERQAWLAERKRLFEKKYSSGLTKSEANRLEYVGWSLDRIQDARTGSALDDLEAMVSMYEKFSTDLSDLKSTIVKTGYDKRSS